ncbi:MAG: PBSX family phage terminase large subunit [Oscillibacter sp.]|nr:PBSX family phage terminase large subunit [Oscillibacter sp.]
MAMTATARTAGTQVKKRRTIPFRFGPEHMEYIRECQNCTFNILEGAVQSGKTIDNVFAFAHELMTTPDKLHLATGSTMANAKLNIGDANGFGLEYIFRGQCRWSRYKDNECLRIKGPSTGGRERIVIFAGGALSDSFKKIRGNSYGMWIATEINLHHDNTIREAFNSQLAAKRRKIFWDLNPESPGAMIYKDYLDPYADKTARGELLGGYNYRHFTIFQNVNIPEQRLKEILSQYEEGSLWYVRDILGQRVIAEGLVYPMFSPERNIVHADPRKTPGRYFISIDYGTDNPTAMGLWRLSEGTAAMIREYYFDSRVHHYQKTDEEYYADLEELAEGYPIERVIVDPSAASFKTCILRHGKFPVWDGDNEVLDGVRLTGTLIQNRLLLFDASCTNTINEFGIYRWNEKKSHDEVVKENDHAMDMVRYFANTIMWREIQ